MQNLDVPNWDKKEKCFCCHVSLYIDEMCNWWKSSAPVRTFTKGFLFCIGLHLADRFIRRYDTHY